VANQRNVVTVTPFATQNIVLPRNARGDPAADGVEKERKLLAAAKLKEFIFADLRWDLTWKLLAENRWSRD